MCCDGMCCVKCYWCGRPIRYSGDDGMWLHVEAPRWGGDDGLLCRENDYVHVATVWVDDEPDSEDTDVHGMWTGCL